MKIAVFADLHLPDDDTTVKERVLDWALDAAAANGAEGIACIGDMTAFGTAPAAQRLGRKLRGTGLPFWFTPGNAELRCGNELNGLLQLIGANAPPDDLLLLDTSAGRLSPESRAYLESFEPGSRLALTHYPPESLPESDRELLRSIRYLAAGHAHYDHCVDGWHIVRGMDPDKAIGAPPGIVLFTRNPGGGWEREDLTYSEADAASWPAAEWENMLHYLGISGMEAPLENLELAIREGIAVYEIRYGEAALAAQAELQKLLHDWRHAGGHTLSLHLSELRWREGTLTGREQLDRAAELAVSLGCDRVTFHVPGVSLADFRAPAVYDRILQETVSALKPLIVAGIVVGIENMHMKPGEKNDLTRGFGYTIEECREWIQTLRTHLGPELTGFHFDLGHARNNAPYSSMQPISSWYAALGHWINGFHLHQVAPPVDGRMENHTALTAPFDPLISLASLFAAWRCRQVNHAPLILEIRQGRGPESYRALRDYLRLGTAFNSNL